MYVDAHSTYKPILEVLKSLKDMVFIPVDRRIPLGVLLFDVA
jgi:hypothetical protein